MASKSLLGRFYFFFWVSWDFCFIECIIFFFVIELWKILNKEYLRNTLGGICKVSFEYRFFKLKFTNISLSRWLGWFAIILILATFSQIIDHYQILLKKHCQVGVPNLDVQYTTRCYLLICWRSLTSSRTLMMVASFLGSKLQQSSHMVVLARWTRGTTGWLLTQGSAMASFEIRAINVQYLASRLTYCCFSHLIT